MATALWPAPLCAQAAPLRILVEDAAEPFSNGDGSGYANELVRAAFSAAGMAVELVVVPYARCKALVLAGTEAACFSMSHEPELQGAIQFSQQPLFSVTPVYFQNRQQPLQALREAELGAGVSIGIVNGYEYPESLSKARQRGAQLVVARSEQVNLKKLALGRIDAALVMDSDLHSARRVVQEAGVGDAVLATFSSSRQDSYIGFSRKHPHGAAALAAFNRGFAQISADGLPKRLASKWSTR
ncbi:MAG: transporter substrate-binding domain-containing protein [Sphingomonadaceae bacterium]